MMMMGLTREIYNYGTYILYICVDRLINWLHMASMYNTYVFIVYFVHGSGEIKEPKVWEFICMYKYVHIVHNMYNLECRCKSLFLFALTRQ